MSGGANKRREVLKFEGDDINEYIDGRVNGVTHNESEWRMERQDRQKVCGRCSRIRKFQPKPFRGSIRYARSFKMRPVSLSADASSY
jgi:hypothetical protein